MTSTDALSRDDRSPPPQYPQQGPAELSPQRAEVAAEDKEDPDVQAAFASAPPDGSAMISYAGAGDESLQGSEDPDPEEEEDLEQDLSFSEQPFGVQVDHQGDVSGISRRVRALEVLSNKPVPKSRAARSGTPPPCPIVEVDCE